MDGNNIYFALPEPFDPLTTTLDFEQWVKKFKACAVANQWQEADQLRHLPTLLRGDAWIQYDDLSENQKDTMDHLVQNLSQKLNMATQFQSAEKLYQRTFDSRVESLLTYLNDSKRLTRHAYPGMTQQQTAPIVLTAFIRGLRGHSASLARKVRNSNPNTVQQALEKAQFILSDPFDDDTNQGNEVLTLSRSNASDSIQREEAEYLQSDAKEEASHSTPHGPPSWLPDVINAIRKANTCDYCGRSGHEVSNCFKKMRDEGAAPADSRRPTSWVNLQPRKRQRQDGYRSEYPKTPGAICTYCAKMNHTAEQCLIKKRADALKKQLSPENC